jgi:tetraacyldisaccharide 4'-kinase
LRQASLIVLTHTNLVKPSELEALKGKIKGLAPEAFVVETYLEPLFFFRARKRVRVSLERLRNQRVTTFSAIGTPRSLQALLARFQIKTVRNFEFTDHHLFSAQELEEIKRVSESASVAEIITTEKDYYRSPKEIAGILDPLILAARLRIASGEEMLYRIGGQSPGGTGKKCS